MLYKDIPLNEKGLPMTEEEVDAAIEELQQKITLRLQEIDRNFTLCNRILSFKILPAVDQFAQGTNQIRKHSMTWLPFFQAMNQQDVNYSNGDEESKTSSSGTNRPPMDDDDATVPSRSVWRFAEHVTTGDITREARGHLQLQPRTTGEMHTGVNPMPVGRYKNLPTLTPSTGSTSRPPLAASLRGTPIHEEASIVTENHLRSIGAYNSDSDSMGDTPTAAQQQQLPKNSKSVRAWEVSNMDIDDPESRKKFNSFLESRQQKFQDMPVNSELQPIRPSFTSPSRSTRNSHQMLVNTPTIERVMNNKQQNLRESTSLKRSRYEVEVIRKKSIIASDDDDDNVDVDSMSEDRERFIKSPTSFNHMPSSLSSTPYRQEEVGGRAYEFANTLSQVSKSKQRQSIVPDEGSPAQFSLQNFPEAFRIPQLTAIYQVFDQRPGIMLTVEQVVSTINDDSFEKKYTEFFINLLADRNYLEKVEGRNAWVVCR